jgi:hypothetical protein
VTKKEVEFKFMKSQDWGGGGGGGGGNQYFHKASQG